MRKIADERELNNFHHDLQHPRTEKDKYAVMAIISVIEWWVNLFTNQQDVMNI